MKNTQSKLKPIKTGKELGTTDCLGCKGFNHNLKPQEVKMINKVLTEKCNCVVCRSNKSRFLKQKHYNCFDDYTNYLRKLVPSKGY